MTLIWVIVAVVVAAIVGSVALAAYRDRRRRPSADEAAANRTATAEAERHAAGRHGAQGTQWERGHQAGGGGGF